MKKRKVLFITPSLCQGGLEHYLIKILQMLDYEKFDITLFLYLKDVTLLPHVPECVRVIIDNEQNHYQRQIRVIWYRLIKVLSGFVGIKNTVERYSEKMRNHIHSERMKHPAKDYFANEHFDYVLVNAVGRPVEMALHIDAGKRYVFYHSSLDIHHEKMESLFPQYDGIVAVSSGVKNMLQNAYPSIREKITILENYIDANEVIEKSNVFENSCELTSDKHIISIATCGRLSKEKGFDLAVEAAAKLDKSNCSFVWYFVGDGKDRNKIEGLIEKYSLQDKIYITGYMDNPYPVIKQCDIYVQPSYEESYGRSIKEAIILGCPIVSTATVGGYTLVKEGENGILTDINADALANGIKRLIDDCGLRNRLSNTYSLEHNLIERKVFKDGLEKLLS